jgi:hypothetical protein
MPKKPPDVIGVNLDKGNVYLEGGKMVPIVHFFDEMGDDCEPTEAVSIVAGDDAIGWYSMDLNKKSSARMH